SVTNPMTDVPSGITEKPSTTTSSVTFKSTTSPTWAVAEEIVLPSFKWIGTPLRKVNSEGEAAGMGATGAGVGGASYRMRSRAGCNAADCPGAGGGVLAPG